MNKEQFYDIVEESISMLPGEFKEKLDNIEIIVRNLPDKETQEKIEKGGLLLGLYTGIPLTVRGSGYGGAFYGFVPPDRIYLYKKNIEKYCSYTRASMINQITDTLFHEIGHYMGLGEEEVRALKYKHIENN